MRNLRTMDTMANYTNKLRFKKIYIFQASPRLKKKNSFFVVTMKTTTVLEHFYNA
jgi:hypothetical protein